MHSSGTIYYRLDSIIILGTPSCTTIEQKGDPWEAIFLGVYGSETTENIEFSLQDSIGEYIYIQQMARIVAGVDAKTGMSKLCPNLKYFSIPKAEILLAKKVKVQELNKKCNASLNMLCDSLNEQLRKHPYYDHSVISFELHSSQYEDTYQTITNKYNQQETQLRQEFKDLVSGKMDSNLKKNYTQQYLIAYQRQHPEHKHIIDSVYQEYRCYTDSVQSIFVVKVLEGYTINSKSCRQKQYQQYATLFDNKYDYDSIYNKVSSNKEFMQEIAKREDAQESLDELQGILLENPKIKLHGIKTAKKGVPLIITEHLDSLQKTHFYDRAVKLILETNKPINAEYLKNGHYFANQQEFFEAYISPEYKKILKTNKMSK